MVPTEPHSAEQQLLNCEACCKQVPKSAALSTEASDYIYYFCGAECLAQFISGASRHERRNEDGDGA